MAALKATKRRLILPARSRTTPRAALSRSAMFRDVVMLFYATSGRLQRLKRLVASAVGLNSAEYSVVAALYRLGPNASVRVRDIAKYLHMAPENVTTSVGKLVKAKWVVKAIDPGDARAVTLTLHRSARQRIDNLTKELIDVNDVWFRDMDAAEIQQLCQFLERVLDNFDAAYHKARNKFGVH